MLICELDLSKGSLSSAGHMLSYVFPVQYELGDACNGVCHCMIAIGTPHAGRHVGA